MVDESRSRQPIVLYLGGFDLPDKNAAAHRAIGNSKALRDLGFRTILVGFQTRPGRPGVIRERLPKKEASIQLVTVNTAHQSFRGLSYRANPTAVFRLIHSLGGRRPLAALICYNFPSV